MLIFLNFFVVFRFSVSSVVNFSDFVSHRHVENATTHARLTELFQQEHDAWDKQHGKQNPQHTPDL